MGRSDRQQSCLFVNMIVLSLLLLVLFYITVQYLLLLSLLISVCSRGTEVPDGGRRNQSSSRMAAAATHQRRRRGGNSVTCDVSMRWVTRGLAEFSRSLRGPVSSREPPPVRNMSAGRPATILGTMAFGGRADAELSRNMVQTYLDRDHSQLDTAFMYMEGRSEAVIGGMDLPRTGEAPV